MANPSTGFFGPGQPNPYSNFPFYVDVNSFVGFVKAGGTDNVANTIDGYAVRSTVFSNVAVGTTETTVAHNLVDENGNPIAPVGIDQLAGPGVLFSTAAPDATNLYLQATVSGNYTFRVRY